MKLNNTITFVLSYAVAVIANFFISIKYPDATISDIGLIVSIILMVIIFRSILILEKGIKLKRKKILLLLAFQGSIICYIGSILATLSEGNIATYAIVNIHYFVYVMFVTPFFGLNYMTNLLYGEFSLVVAVIYVILLIVLHLRGRKLNDNYEDS